jgi:DNA replication protein DnaC
MIEQTVYKLQVMKLYRMAEVFNERCTNPKHAGADVSEVVAFMVEAEYDKRKNNRITRLLRQARLKMPTACLEDLDYTAKRTLKKSMINDIVLSNFIDNRHNILISGPTGVGKSYIACAFANLAARKTIAAKYFRVSKFLEYMAAEKALGNYLKAIEKIGKIPVLILDDLGPDVMDKKQRNIMMEVIEERYLTATTILASQLQIGDWYSVFDEPSTADAIMDRLLHNAHKIELDGDSMRKNR